MDEKTCPWCAERINAAALKCRYCGSRVNGGVRDPRDWHRGYPDRRLAGVCAAVAHNLGVSVTVVRAVFLLLAFVHGFGIALYAILWFLLPEAPAGRSALDRVADALRHLLGREVGGGGTGSGASGPSGAGERSGGEGASGGWSPTRS